MSSYQVITTAPAGSKEWLEKHPPLGSHDVASLLGVGRKTKLAVWAEATGKAKREDISHRPEIRRGILFEPIIGKLFENETGRKVLPTPGLIQHPTIPYLGVTPDGLTTAKDGSPAAYEAKSVGFHPARSWRVQVPLMVQVQCQVQAWTLELPWASVAALCMTPEDNDEGGEDPLLLWQDMPADAELHERMGFAIVQFWETYVVKDIPPAVTEDDVKVVKRMFPREIKGEIGNLEPDIESLWDARTAHLAVAKEAKDRADGLEAQIKLAMGDKEFLQGASYSLRWRVEPRKGYTVEASEPRILRKVKGLS